MFLLRHFLRILTKTKVQPDVQKKRHFAKQRMTLFRRFWVKEPRHSENISAKKKCCYFYRSACQTVRIFEIEWCTDVFSFSFLLFFPISGDYSK